MSGKAGKKGGKGGKGALDPEKEKLKLDLQRALLRVEALERDLFSKKEQTRQAIRVQNELRDRVIQYHADMDKERADRRDIMADMTRQYVNQQETLLDAQNKLAAELESVKDELELLKEANKRELREKDEIIAHKEREIAEQKRHIEEMTQDFSNMLHETLSKMTEKMKQGESFENEPLPEGLEAFGVKPTKS
ncbi:hypothetical protein PAPYR_4390 [Paratrimastix pyriformis]|uniref:Dynein regulatory complex protein 12 n=1 Tax=Paratrimastix pyriformis TaxID=342808 RepID=A0ABQ8UK95_9EUKA|nr:hypothetical protein PAPYR_4390 [Paratrimastix pyriformis]